MARPPGAVDAGHPEDIRRVERLLLAQARVTMSKPWVLASAAQDTVQIWELDSAQYPRAASDQAAAATPVAEVAAPTATMRPHGPHGCNCVRWDHTGSLLGTAGDDGCIHITSPWDQATTPVATLQPEDALASPVNCFGFSTGSGYLCSGATDGVVRVWDMKQRHTLQRFEEHQRHAITCISFSANDSHIASGNTRGGVLIHKLASQQLSATLSVPATEGGGGGASSPSTIKHLEFSRLRKALLGAVTSLGSVYVWDINVPEQPFTSFARQHDAACTSIAFSPVNQVLFASAAMDGRIVFYDVQQRKIVKVLPTESPITSMCFHSDGVTVAAGASASARERRDRERERGPSVVD